MYIKGSRVIIDHKCSNFLKCNDALNIKCKQHEMTTNILHIAYNAGYVDSRVQDYICLKGS